jgi:hypothetical protein
MKPRPPASALPRFTDSKLTARFLLIVLVLGHPVLISLGFSIWGYFSRFELRFLSSTLAEIVALAIGSMFLVTTLKWLRDRQSGFPSPRFHLVVNATSLMYLALLAVILANLESAGLFSQGGRLDFYFENDWFRRLVTFSYVPMGIATYHALHSLRAREHSPGFFPFVLNLGLLGAFSLLSGSKGAAVLVVVAAIGFVFTIRPLSLVKAGLVMGVFTVAYIALFLFLSADASSSLLGIVQRFYYSIDMSILLQEPAVSEALSGKLGDVWVEVFRNLSNAGVRVSDLPIGSLVYDYAFGVPPETGANCRFGSLMLLYPERLDFLVGFPLVVCVSALLFGSALKDLGLEWSSKIAMPFLVFQAFQDVYWFTSHFLPILLLFAAVQAAKAIQRATVGSAAHAR